MQDTLERLRSRRAELGDQGGFTLIELLIVIVILGILAAIVVFAVLGKTTDWLIEVASAPLLRWQDAFGRQGGDA